MFWHESTDGLTMESNHIYVEMIDGKYTVILPDTDGDGLEDCYEIYYGSDINLTDTDGDGLDDYYEVAVSGTNPAKKDTDENGIEDGDEDYDKDGLTILEEYKIGTDPWDDDTDGDGLKDGEEVKTYNTDPLDPDSDDDELNDGDEILLGTDPLNPDTNNNGIIDGREKYQQTYTHKVENEGCVIKEVSISLEGTGCLQTNTSIKSIMNKDIICTDVVGLVGEPFDINTTSRFDKATLTFKLDESALGDTSFDDLLFLWYNEEEPVFVELESILDKTNMTISVETTHFSKYMIVDKNVWHEAWATELNYEADNGIDTYYTVLTIDCSGSMKTNDPITTNSNISSAYDAIYNRKTCNRIQGALEFVNCMSENDRVAIVLFDDTAFYTLDFTNDKEEIKLALQKICNDGGTNYNNAISKSINMFERDILDSASICTRIVFLTDGEGSCQKSYITLAKNKGIIIHCIGLGTGVNYNNLKDMADGTEGSYHYAGSSESLLDLYERIYLGDKFDKTDNDHDGLYDIFEIQGIRLVNGKIIYTDPTDNDSDDDGLLYGQEIDTNVKKLDASNVFLNELFGDHWYYLNMKSDPTKIDSDGDGLKDKGYLEGANGKICAPEDQEPLYKNGPDGIWAKKYSYESNNMVPRRLDGYRDMGKELRDYYTNIYGSRFLDFYVDETNNILHSKAKQWQKGIGYRNLWDGFFALGTAWNMDKLKVVFGYDSEEYALWMWKGDYPNLGSGAEIGLYTDKDVKGQWDAIEFVLPMSLNLYYGSNYTNIFSWQPIRKQWWITGFNPDYRNQYVENMTVIGSINFSQKRDIYSKLKAEKEDDDRFIFDDSLYTVWIVW